MARAWRRWPMTEKKKSTRKRKAAEAELPLNGEATPETPNGAHDAEQPKRTRRKIEEAEAAAQADPIEQHLNGDTPANGDVPDESLRQELIAQLDALIKRLRAMAPGYNPPPFSPTKLVNLVEEN